MWTRTFDELRKEVMVMAGIEETTILDSSMTFSGFSTDHNDYWDELNKVEFDRGYVKEEYERSDTSALCDMKLLTEEEYQYYLEAYRAIHIPR